MTSVVYSHKVAGYDDIGSLTESVRYMLTDSGLLDTVTPEKRVVIKPNLVTGKSPDAACTTHPAVVQAIIDVLREAGAENITIAESPSSIYTPTRLKSVYKACGYDGIHGARLNTDCAFAEVSSVSGYCVDRFNIIRPITDADIIINVSKLKTHSLMILSGAVKNLFGCIPGLQKPEMHCAYPEIGAFSEMLTALCLTVKPSFHIMDAITCMEGNGPTGGIPKEGNALFGSINPFALDHVAADKMGISPNSIEILRIAEKHGLYDPQNISLRGSTVTFVTPFVIPDTRRMDLSDHVPGILQKPFRKITGKLFKIFPQVDEQKCVGCGRCAESCPMHIIRIENHKARFQKRGCITCFCCQEMCPEKAVYVKRKMLI